MKRWFLPIAITVIPVALSCKTIRREVKAPDPYFEPALATIMTQFKRDAAGFGKPVSSWAIAKLRVVSFVSDVERKRAEYGMAADPHGDTAGACTDAKVTNKVGEGALEYRLSESSWQEIWISQQYSHDPHGWQLKELVYHELGHCLLGLDHKKGPDHGIMSSSIHKDPQWIAANWDRMVRELFGQP